jgi:hypothetical protein
MVVPRTELLTVFVLARENRTFELFFCEYRVVSIVGRGGRGSPGALEIVLPMLMDLWLRDT